MLDMKVVTLLLFCCWCSGVAGFWWCALGLFGAELQLDFDQVVVAVEGSAWERVDVVYNVPPILVDNSVI